MNSNLGAGATLELLDRLRSTMRDLAARADKLDKEFHTRMGRERRHHEAAVAEQAKELSAVRGESEAAVAAAKQAAEAKYEQRKGWIGRAYQASKEKGLADIEDQTGVRKYELQKLVLQGERDRDTGLATAAATLEDFRANLAAEQQVLALREREVHTAFKGYRTLVRLLAAAGATAETGAAPDENQTLAKLRELLSQTQKDQARFRKFLLLRIFKYWPVWVVVILCEAAFVFLRFGVSADSAWKAGGCVVASLAALVALRYLGRSKAGPQAAAIARALSQARQLHAAAAQQGEAHHRQEIERIKNEFKSTTRQADQELKQAVARASESRVACRMESDGRASRILQQNEQRYRRKLDRLERGHGEAMQQLVRAAEVRQKAEAEANFMQ